jgi:hypothetical protein
MISLIETNHKPKTFKKTIWMNSKMTRNEVYHLLESRSMFLVREPFNKIVSISYNHENGETVVEIMF